MSKTDLVIGIDGGGSKTLACLGTISEPDTPRLIASGVSQSSNPMTRDIDRTITEIDRSIDDAFHNAEISRRTCVALCVGLAGGDRPTEQEPIIRWAIENQIAHQIHVTNDAVPILYAESSTGIGVAAISGTGSLVLGQNDQSEIIRCGGWGSVIGDDGSGFDIGRSALRAAFRFADDLAPHTELLERLLDHFHIADASKLLGKVYSHGVSPAEIAKLAAIVFQAHQSGDEAASSILKRASLSLSDGISNVARRLGMSDRRFPLYFSGGLLVHYPQFRRMVESNLNANEVVFGSQIVKNPGIGALNMAANLAAKIKGV